MKKIFALLLLLSSLALHAQTTAVTATLTYPDTQVLAGAKVTAVFTPNPSSGFPANQYLLNGAAFTQAVTATANSSGVFTMTLSDDRIVTPSDGSWLFTICPPVNSACFNSLQNVHGASQDLSAALSANAAPVGGQSFGIPVYYNDTEASSFPGGIYFNYTTQSFRFFGSGSWQSNGCSLSGTGPCTLVSVYGTPPTPPPAGQSAISFDTSGNPVVSINGGAYTSFTSASCPLCAIGPGASTAGHAAVFSGTDGITLADGGPAPSGTVTNIATTSPIGGGPITNTGTLTCTTCVVATVNPSAGLLRVAGSTQTATGAELSGDVTTSGSNAATVVQIEGAAIPVSAAVVGTNASKQAVAATSHGVSAPLQCVPASGSGTAYTCTTTPTFTPAAGDEIMFKADVASGASPTLNVNSSSAAPIKKWGGSAAVIATDFAVGTWCPMVYDGTNWQVNCSAITPPQLAQSNTWTQQNKFNAGALVPSAAGGTAVGLAALPFSGLIFGTAATNNFNLTAFATTGARIIDVPDFGVSSATTQIFPSTTVLTSQYTNSTTGFTNVAGGATMAIPVAANLTYTMTCHLYYQAASTAGLNIEFTGPASPTAVAYGLTLPVSATTFAGLGVATAYSTSLGSVVTTTGTNFDAIVSFSLINGTNAGTVNLLAKSSAAAQLQIQAGSYCKNQ